MLQSSSVLSASIPESIIEPAPSSVSFASIPAVKRRASRVDNATNLLSLAHFEIPI